MTEDAKARRREYLRNYKEQKRRQIEISACFLETAFEDLKLTRESSATKTDGFEGAAFAPPTARVAFVPSDGREPDDPNNLSESIKSQVSTV